MVLGYSALHKVSIRWSSSMLKYLWRWLSLTQRAMAEPLRGVNRMWHSSCTCKPLNDATCIGVVRSPNLSALNVIVLLVLHAGASLVPAGMTRALMARSAMMTAYFSAT